MHDFPLCGVESVQRSRAVRRWREVLLRPWLARRWLRRARDVPERREQGASSRRVRRERRVPSRPLLLRAGLQRRGLRYRRAVRGPRLLWERGVRSWRVRVPERVVWPWLRDSRPVPAVPESQLRGRSERDLPPRQVLLQPRLVRPWVRARVGVSHRGRLPHRVCGPRPLRVRQMPLQPRLARQRVHSAGALRQRLRRPRPLRVRQVFLRSRLVRQELRRGGSLRARLQRQRHLPPRRVLLQLRFSRPGVRRLNLGAQRSGAPEALLLRLLRAWNLWLWYERFPIRSATRSLPVPAGLDGARL